MAYQRAQKPFFRRSAGDLDLIHLQISVQLVLLAASDLYGGAIDETLRVRSPYVDGEISVDKMTAAMVRDQFRPQPAGDSDD
jgi:hypothetical protein